MSIRKIVLSLLLLSFNTQAYVVNENNPQEYRSFKSNYSDMIELANKSLLPQVFSICRQVQEEMRYGLMR